MTPPPKPSLWENIQYWYSVVWEYIDPFLKIIWSFLKKLYVVFLVIFNVYVWFYFWPEYYLWSPGGKQDPGETLEETAIRELKEETGVILYSPMPVFEMVDHEGWHTTTFVGGVIMPSNFVTNELG